MKTSLLRRLLSVILCVSILLGASFSRPQKAEAFAISASVVASVIMIMTACGVTFWASTQGDAESYISEKLGEYLDQLTPTPASILDWLGITELGSLFVVLTGGVARFDSNVANRILDFVRWFNNAESVTSGGPAVTQMPAGWSGQPIPVTSSNTTAVLYETGFKAASADPYGNGGSFIAFGAPSVDADIFVTAYTSGNYIYFLVGTNRSNGSDYARACKGSFNSSGNIVGSSGSVSFNQFSGDCRYSDDTSRYMWLPDSPTVACPYFTAKEDALAALLDVCSAGLSPIAAVTPSDVVAVPDDLPDDETFDVTPSAMLSEGMSVDDASSAVFDGATSADGLSSEGSTSQSGPLDWLSDILSAIHDLIAGIAQTVLGIPQAIGQAASDVIRGVVEGVQQVLIDVFVPDEAFIGEFVASLYATFDNRFSILSYPFSILGEFITRASGIGSPEPILRWPDIFEPFSHQKLISAGSYNLNSIKSNQSFNTIYDLYMLILKGYLSFDFLTFLYLWFCDVFRMREDDFDNPYDIYLASKEAGEE